MHLVAHGFHLLDGDVLREQTVQFIRQVLLFVAHRLHIEVSHHHPGMHACIRPAGTRHLDILTEDG